MLWLAAYLQPSGSSGSRNRRDDERRPRSHVGPTAVHDLGREQLFVAIEGKGRVPLPAREIYSAAARHDADSDQLLLSWVQAELDR
jgi:hypothetical protein